jgi:ABC-type transport system involved in multi-copper enzyme maturation permease subunit
MSAHRSFSVRRVMALAGNTFRELVRQKVFSFLVLFALLVIGGSLFAVKLTFQEQFQVLKDISLGAMSIFLWLISVLTTASLIPRDLEDRTLYTILAKPVPRFEYVVGKLGGVFAVLGVACGAMSVAFLAVLWVKTQGTHAEIIASYPAGEEREAALRGLAMSSFSWNLMPGIALILLKAMVCAAVTLFISTFASSMVFTVMVSVVVYLIGHLQGVARDYWLTQGELGLAGRLGNGFVALVFPDLQMFNVVDEIALGTAVPAALFGQVAGFAGLYIVVYLLCAQWVFSEREL